MSIKKRRKLSFEIVGIIVISLLISFILFSILLYFTLAFLEQYFFDHDIILDEFEYYKLDTIVLIISLIISVIVFIFMFLILFKDKISYIKVITKGIDSLCSGNYDNEVLIKGNNELSTLAESINKLSKQEKEVKDKEKKLNIEKEELIRNLSHDIRTPLTSIISYTELLSSKEKLTEIEQKEYFLLILKKSKQIKEITDILLDGNKRELTYFNDATFLIKQLVDEFIMELEDDFKLSIDVSLLNKFGANIDVNEFRRIFDNLSTNIEKYACKEHEVTLKISKDEKGLLIKQTNIINNNFNIVERHNIGINSIKRIAQNYDGNVLINKNDETFEIIISFINL